MEEPDAAAGRISSSWRRANPARRRSLLGAAGAAALALSLSIAGRPVPACAGSDTPLIEAGRSLFSETCQPCHGPTATDGGAGDIRGIGRASVARATRGIEQMPAFDLSEEQIEAIAAFLDTLDGS